MTVETSGVSHSGDDVRAKRHLQNKQEKQKPQNFTNWVEPAEKKHETQLRGQSHRSPPDTGCGITGSGICYDGFRSCFGPVFPLYDLISPFRNGDVYSVSLYVENNLFFHFTVNYNLEIG